MNYIELINSFWQLDEEYSFTGNETRLYFYLLKKCNSLRWKNPFANADDYTAVAVGISVNTLKSVRNRLKQAGLIDFKPGGNGARNKCTYEIKVSIFDTLPDTLPDETLTPSAKKSDSISKQQTKPNVNQTKETTGAEAPVVEKKVLVNPFSEKFLTEWQVWKDYKKQEHRFGFKSVESEQAAINELVNLSGGSEDAAKAIIHQSLAKGWKGLFQLKNEHDGHSKNGAPGGGKAKGDGSNFHSLLTKRYGQTG